jgi:drug/metabolite transporter (DMT)-like permease
LRSHNDILSIGDTILIDPEAPHPAEVTVDYVAAITWLVVACGVAPLVMIELALRRAPVVCTSPYLFVTSPFPLSSASGWFGEHPSTVQIAGGIAALAGILVATLAIRPSRNQPSPT